MKTEDLVIGKDYWLDDTQTEKETYVGVRKSTGGIYFKPSGKTAFLAYSGNEQGFKGCVGFSFLFNGINEIKTNHE